MIRSLPYKIFHNLFHVSIVIQRRCRSEVFFLQAMDLIWPTATLVYFVCVCVCVWGVPILMAVRSTVCSRVIAGNAGLNPAVGMGVHLLCFLCVV
jgi:hypothetical protein